MMETPPTRARKGRGATFNPDVRFESQARSVVDDGWGTVDEPLPPLRTTVETDASRSVLTRNTSPDVPFDRSINPYRGCEHGCVYCFARPSHAFLGLSPGLDFETRLFAKPNAPALLEKELRRPSYRCQPVALGTNTDPYQPIEREHRITRGILEVLRDFNHPFTIVTKSALILRDLDIIGPMAARGMARVCLSVTTLDDGLAATLEPRAVRPGRRLAVLRELSTAGVPTGILAAPMIPGLNDHELEAILAAGRDAGAVRGGYILIRLPHELDALLADWLATHVPDRARRVLALIRQCREGALNDARFGLRMRGAGPLADLLARRFQVASRRIGMEEARLRPDLDCSRFMPPPRAGDQLTLF